VEGGKWKEAAREAASLFPVNAAGFTAEVAEGRGGNQEEINFPVTIFDLYATWQWSQLL